MEVLHPTTLLLFLKVLRIPVIEKVLPNNIPLLVALSLSLSLLHSPVMAPSFLALV